ncbi:putative B3 domain-containing protein At5g66980 isoform X2 [Ziziphus jujuba]|uniref:B3 domain-containing protein At5g66980 isoform X2 n=1 Tax=Ziziphus jujuba TaxID=326968 RepID=A0A6P6GEH7_ZIZJJ|nr:putative B3 domain-containing protein At5g66980 isoform X2 [Ziziphus jujuba]
MAGASSSSKGIEFFKVFLPSSSSNHMSIPPAFVNKLKAGLPGKAILKDFSGRSWHVGLEIIERHLHFTSGWEKFASDHFLEHGDFLIFKYDGNSLFNVKIFGLNGCKKEVVNNEGIKRGQVKDKEEEEQKKKEDNKDAQTDNSPSDEQNGSKKRKRATTKLEENEIQDTAECVQPKNPRFVVNITKYYRYFLHVPGSFLNEHRIKLMHDLILHHQNDKWPVKVVIRNDGRHAITTGWIDFVRKNEIEAKDKCVFDAVLGTSNTCEQMHVQVIRAKPRVK